MKRIISLIGILLPMLFNSCSEIAFGDKFLGDAPEESGATLEDMFSNFENSEKVLNMAYRGLNYGLSVSKEPILGGNVLESLTDLCQSFRNNIADGPINVYYGGQLNSTSVASNAMYNYGKSTDWSTIKHSWIYLENIDKVDMDNQLKNQRKGEARVLIALSYFRMMRYVGGVNWLDHAVPVNAEMIFPRITFAETIDNIVELLDEAIPLMVWKQDDVNDGRMTKAAAMALKQQVLLWAASPTFNSDILWHEKADKYTCYGNYDKNRWVRAEKAGKDFFNELAKYPMTYGLIMPDGDNPSHKDRRLAYRKAYYDRGGSEILISIRKGFDSSIHTTYYDNRFFIGPTLNYVDMFPWADGTPFEGENFDWKNPSKQPFFTYSKTNGMVPTRDPRLYENIACPGDTYFDGTSAPVYSNCQNYHTGSGFLVMKYILQEAGDRLGRPVQWSFLRLSEVMLSYAEVLNEVHSGPTVEAYKLVNDVRKRVGLSPLKDLNQDQFKAALLNERALELGFEEVRWFDLVRHGMVECFTKKLYGIRSLGNNLNNPTSFTFEKVPLEQVRYWAFPDKWDSKWFMSPIPLDELNKDYGMTQNPGW